jgi:adenylate cyclase
MRVNRTFAFLDLCGFTRYTDVHGDAAAVAALAHLRMVLRGLSERRGVRVTKWLGDGAMLSSVDALSLVACVVEARDELAASPLAVRVGVAHGAVIMFEGDDYVGAPVNLAARLCRAAGPGGILAAVDRIRWDSAMGVCTAHHSTMQVEGLEDEVAVVEVVGLATTEALPSAG